MRALHINLREALRAQSGNNNKTLSLTSQAKQELRWWYNNIQSHRTSPLTTFMKPCLTIITDASPIACGGILTTPMHTTTRGDWTQTERKLQPPRIVSNKTLDGGVCSYFSTHTNTINPTGTGIQNDTYSDGQYNSNELHQSDGRNTLVCTDRDS